MHWNFRSLFLKQLNKTSMLFHFHRMSSCLQQTNPVRCVHLHETCHMPSIHSPQHPVSRCGRVGFPQTIFYEESKIASGSFVPLHLFYFQWFIYPELQFLLLAKLAHQSTVPRSCCLAVWCDGLQLWVILNSTFTVIFVQQYEQIWTSVCKGLEWTTSCMSCRFALGNQLLETDCRP